jgi:hypothetical protein
LSFKHRKLERRGVRLIRLLKCKATSHLKYKANFAAIVQSKVVTIIITYIQLYSTNKYTDRRPLSNRLSPH